MNLYVGTYVEKTANTHLQNDLENMTVKATLRVRATHGIELNQETSRPRGNSGIWQHVKPADHGKELKLPRLFPQAGG